MALYAFDGTWNIDEQEDAKDSNVVRFKEIYAGAEIEYLEGVGTRFGAIGRIVGGLFGVGGRSRIEEMYDALCENWENGDKDIDIIGFSRGAALALHFANKLGKDGIKRSDGRTEPAEIRFLGLWDVVGSFGLSFDTFIDFQEINLGWDIDSVNKCAQHCFHAMALDERRETFKVTRLDPEHKCDHIKEVWFRGVHSDVGGGNENPKRSNIALNWMLDRARESGLPINETIAKLPKYSEMDDQAPFSENNDVKRDPRRKVRDGDESHPTAMPKVLRVGESHTCTVLAKLKYNWSGMMLESGASYQFMLPAEQQWQDKDIKCGPEGWSSEDLPWFEEKIVKLFQDKRRHQKANWFELIGALGDEDDHLFRIGKGDELYTATETVELYLFANDLQSRYGNNQGSLRLRITRKS